MAVYFFLLLCLSGLVLDQSPDYRDRPWAKVYIRFCCLAFGIFAVIAGLTFFVTIAFFLLF